MVPMKLPRFRHADPFGYTLLREAHSSKGEVTLQVFDTISLMCHQRYNLSGAIDDECHSCDRIQNRRQLLYHIASLRDEIS